MSRRSIRKRRHRYTTVGPVELVIGGETWVAESATYTDARESIHHAKRVMRAGESVAFRAGRRTGKTNRARETLERFIGVDELDDIPADAFTTVAEGAAFSAARKPSLFGLLARAWLMREAAADQRRGVLFQAVPVNAANPTGRRVLLIGAGAEAAALVAAEAEAK